MDTDYRVPKEYRVILENLKAYEETLAAFVDAIPRKSKIRFAIKHFGKLILTKNCVFMFSNGDPIKKRINAKVVIDYLEDFYARLSEDFGEDAEQIFIDTLPKIDI